MKKTLFVFGAIALILLVTISFASAVTITNNVKNKDSPLYGVRTGRAIKNKIIKIMNNFKIKFLQERRICFLPFLFLRNGEVLPVNNIRNHRTGFYCKRETVHTHCVGQTFEI